MNSQISIICLLVSVVPDAFTLKCYKCESVSGTLPDECNESLDQSNRSIVQSETCPVMPEGYICIKAVASTSNVTWTMRGCSLTEKLSSICHGFPVSGARLVECMGCDFNYCNGDYTIRSDAVMQTALGSLLIIICVQIILITYWYQELK